MAKKMTDRQARNMAKAIVSKAGKLYMDNRMSLKDFDKIRVIGVKLQK